VELVAAEIGVSDDTLRTARGKSTASSAAVAKRTGKDGKARLVPRRAAASKAGVT
jgi:hypothetical protein